MEKPNKDIALDSQCFTYLVTALENVSAPIGDLAVEERALFRSFLYSGTWHFLTPTVDSEWRKISDERKRKIHESWNSVHFGTVPFYNNEQRRLALERAEYLLNFHPKMMDCKILAEAEILGAGKILSYDQKFLKRLESHAQIELVSPSAHWDRLAIQPGSKPKIVPSLGNPMGVESWWCV